MSEPLAIYYTACPVVLRDPRTLFESVQVGGQRKLIPFEKEILWVRISEAHVRIRHRGVEILDVGCFADNSGAFLGCVPAATAEAVRATAKYRITPSDTLQVVVELQVMDVPLVADDSGAGREHNRKFVAKRYAIIENVAEFQDWGPLDRRGRCIKSKKVEIFEAWVQTIRACGYHVEWKVLNAADYGLPQTRQRLFVVARRGRSRRPFPWPEPTHARESWTPAYTVIDWSIPIGSIFDRPKPLVANTIARIEYGLRKFVGPFIAQYHNGGDGKNRVYGLDGPLPTVDTQNRYALTIPFIVKNRGTGKANSLFEPTPTVTAGGNHLGLAVPFLAAHFGEREGQNPRVHDLADPLPTVTSRGAGDLIVPFITKYYGTAKACSVFEPLGTVTTRDRYGLVLAKTMADLGVVDVFYRMFVARELALAQGFDRNYLLHGTDTEQKMQIGNAVPPIFAKVLIQACAADADRRRRVGK